MCTIERTPWHQYGTIAYLSKKLSKSKTFGKTVLQKLVFILQEIENVPCNYDYIFYNYGPYSSELSTDLELLSHIGGVNIEYDAKWNQYRISSADNTSRLEEKAADFLEQYKDTIDGVIERFGNKKAKDLELDATIFFVWKNDFCGQYKRDDIKKRTQELKPRFSEHEILGALNQLEEMRYFS